MLTNNIDTELTNVTGNVENWHRTIETYSRRIALDQWNGRGDYDDY